MYSYAQNYTGYSGSQYYPQSYYQNYSQYYQQPQQQSYQSPYSYAQQSSYSYSPCQQCQVSYQVPQAPAPRALSPVTPPKSSPRPTKLRPIKPVEREPISAFKTVVQSPPEPVYITQTVAPCGQPAPAPCSQPAPAPAPCSQPAPTPAPAPVLAPPAPCAQSGDCTPQGALPTPAPYVSQLEQQIRSSTQPVPSNESNIIEIDGVRGIWLNRAEVESWRGEIPISEYPINDDTNPEVVRLRHPNCADRVQQLAIKYLKPPRPPTPGPIVIKQEPNVPTAPAPPIIIRQLAPEPCQPPPVVVRERPPAPPEPIGPKTVVIPGQRLPPPPRRVIIEKLAQAPPQLQAVTVERWLPYDKRERRVVLEKKPCDPCVEKPKNIIFEWEPQCVNQTTEVRDLGLEEADPQQYVQAHGSSLKAANELPPFVQEVAAPQSLEANNEVSLVGDLQGLRLIDLNREGLAEYSRYVR